MNLKFTISYDGSFYLGSQKQNHKKSVEDEILRVFARLNINTKLFFSGRTDKNVHATGQVFNCIVPVFWDNLEKLKKTLNRHLDSSILIKKISKVEDDFHSRFSAKKRVYRYFITTKELTPFNAKYLTSVSFVDEKKIKLAIKEFIGVYDFKYFHKTGSDKEITTREVFDAIFYKYKDLYIFKFTANSYLRSQIRLMVAFLLKISEGKLLIEDLRRQLALEKRYFFKPAKAEGLYLARVIY